MLITIFHAIFDLGWWLLLEVPALLMFILIICAFLERALYSDLALAGHWTSSGGDFLVVEVNHNRTLRRTKRLRVTYHRPNVKRTEGCKVMWGPSYWWYDARTGEKAYSDGYNERLSNLAEIATNLLKDDEDENSGVPSQAIDVDWDHHGSS